MELIDYELRRFENEKKSPSERNNSPSSKDVKKRQSMIPIGKRRSESVNRLSASSDDFRKSLPTTPINPNKGILEYLTDLDNKKEQEGSKHDQVLQVSVNLLLNLAENTRIEEKMRKRNISRMLMAMLERPSLDLVHLCAKFLKKLSIFKENKDDMIDIGLIEVIVKVLDGSREDVQLASYSLLYNLSFDVRAREQMVNHGLLPRLLSAMSKFTQRVSADNNAKMPLSSDF